MLKKLYLPLLSLMIIQYLFPKELFVVMGVLFWGYESFFRDGKIVSNPIKGFWILVLFVIWGLLLGIINFRSNGIEIRDLIRDLYYYLTPIIFISLGASYSKRNLNLDKIINTIIVWGAIKAAIVILNALINIGTLGAIQGIYYWRNAVGNGDIISAVALVMLFTYRSVDYRLPKWFRKISLAICLTEFVITMSRTCILIFVCMMVILNWSEIKKYKAIKKIPSFILGGCIVAALFYLILPHNIVLSFIEKLLASFMEIGQASDWNSSTDVQVNWRGYETYSALLEWSNFDMVSQLIGRGFGKKIYVGYYAYTLLGQVTNDGSAATSIAILHNGYATNLIKLGLAGDILYLAFYLIQIRTALTAIKDRIIESYSCKILLASSVSLIFITYFLNGLYVTGSPFLPLIIMMGYIGNRIKRVKNVR